MSVVPLRRREQLQHLVFLAGQMHALAVDVDGLGVEVDAQVAGLDDGLGVTLRAAHDGVDAGDQLVLVERLGHVVVGAEAEAAHLVVDAGKPGQDQDRRLHLGDAQRLQNLVAAHVRQVEIQKNDVVVVELAEVDAFLAQIGRVDVETLPTAASARCSAPWRCRPRSKGPRMAVPLRPRPLPQHRQKKTPALFKLSHR